MEDNNLQGEYGRALLAWQVDEYPHHERSRTWYVLGAIGAVALIIYAVITTNFLFAVIIIMAGITTLLSTFQPPEKLDFIITSTGIIIGSSFYRYTDIKNFSIVYEPPEVKNLYLDFEKPWLPLISVPLEENDPNQVRECLLPFCLENLERTNEVLTDVVRRVYKL